MDIRLGRTALVTADEEFKDFLRESLRSISGAPTIGLEILAEYQDIGKEQLQKLREFGPQIVFLDLSADPVVGLRFAQFLTESDPAVRLVGAGPPLSQELLLEAMRAGVSEYLPRPVEPEDLSAALDRLRRRLPRTGGEVEPGRLIALFSAKGGVGTTTAATNLAVQLHRLTGKKTLLVDLDLELGETALHLGVRPRFNFVDMVKNFHRMDAELLASYIERHDSGIHLLSAPLRPERVEELSADEVHVVLNFLKEHYDYLVVDTSKTFSPHTTAAIQQADTVLLLTTPDLPSLRNAKRSIPLLQRLASSSQGRLRLVVNRAHARTVITLEDIRRTLECDIYWTLANDYQAISNSVNAGKPVVLNGAGSQYVKDMKSLSAQIAGLGPGEDGAGGGLGLGRLLRRLARKPAEAAAEAEEKEVKDDE